MNWHRITLVPLLLALLASAGCLNYSFTGTSIPSDVRTIYIPFFDDRSGAGIGDISDQLNRALVNRFVNQSRLSQTGSQEGADAYMDGVVVNYNVRPFSIGGDQQANINEVTITVRASFRYADDEENLWDKNFNGSGTYNVQEDPVAGEDAAVQEALQQIANNMFNDAVGDW